MKEILNFVKEGIKKDIKMLKTETRKFEKKLSLVVTENISFSAHIEPTALMAYHFDATGANYESVSLRNVFQTIKLGEKDRGEKIRRKDIEIRVVFGELGNYIELPPRFWWGIAVEILELKK